MYVIVIITNILNHMLALLLFPLFFSISVNYYSYSFTFDSNLEANNFSI